MHPSLALNLKFYVILGLSTNVIMSYDRHNYNDLSRLGQVHIRLLSTNQRIFLNKMNTFFFKTTAIVVGF